MLFCEIKYIYSSDFFVIFIVKHKNDNFFQSTCNLITFF